MQDYPGPGSLTLADPIRTLFHGVALALMLGWILFLGRSIFVPVVSSILVVYVVLGVSRLTTGLPVVGPLLPASVHYLIAAVGIGYILIELVATFTANLSALATRAPEFQAALLGLVQSVAERFGIETALTWEMLRREVLGEVNLQATLRSGLTSVASILTGLFFVLLNVAFMMMERRSFFDKLAKMADTPEGSARLLDVVTDINQRVGRYLAVKTLINVVLGVISYGVMALFGLEFAIFWAIIIALLNYIPYIGSIIGVAFPVAMAILQFDGIEDVVALLIALVAVQVAMGNVIEPQVMGNSLNLSPYVILVSLTAWTALWGVSGAIVSVPIMAVLVIVLSEFDATRPIAILLSKNGELYIAKRTSAV